MARVVSATARPADGGAWRPWGTLLSLFLLVAGFIAYAVAPASVLPLLVTEFAIGRATASASISAVFLAWALLQMPGGFVLDRYENRRLVTLGGVVFVLGASGGLLAPNYPTFLLARLLSGASIVFVFVGGVNVLSQVLPEARRALGLSLFVTAPPFGIAVAQSTGPLLAQASGWRTALLAYSGVATLGLLGFVTLGGNPVGSEHRVTVSQFVETLRNRSVILVSTASLCTYAVWTFLVTWMPTYGTEALGFDLAGAGAAAALVPLAGIVARPGGGWLSDRLGGRSRPVVLASFLTSALLLYVLSTAATPAAFAVLLALTGAAVNLSVGLYLVSVTALAGPSNRGTSLSVLLTFSQVGNLIAPVASGWLIARFAWAGGFGFAIGLALVGLVTMTRVPNSG